jgi:hypothetical protein
LRKALQFGSDQLPILERTFGDRLELGAFGHVASMIMLLPDPWRQVACFI